MDLLLLILLGAALLGGGKSSSQSGIGVGGQPRFGQPKTEEERRLTHKALYGTEELPPRGTGLMRRGLI